MCGRFTLATPAQILAGLFGLETADWNDPRFNIAPRTRIVTVRRHLGSRTAQSLIWGATNPRHSRPLINARSETVATSPLFGHAFAASRLLVPADGFFEWTKDGQQRRGRYFQTPGGDPFAFAGLAVRSLADPAGEASMAAVVILTTKASEPVRAYHDRMPLIIRPGSFEQWLDDGTKPEAVRDLMVSGAETPWISHPVGPAVNNVRNDTKENIRPAEPRSPRQGRLF